MSETRSAKSQLSSIGVAPNPPVAVLPDPSSLFLNRSKRFLALAPGHQLEPYLTFLSSVTRAQNDAQAELAPIVLPSAEQLAQARQHGMPPLSRATVASEDAAVATLDRLLETLTEAELPAEAAAAVQSLQIMAREDRRAALSKVLSDGGSQDGVAQRVLLLAALQIHFARTAAVLDAESLKSIADGVCPVCGSPPIVSSVVGWPSAHNTRYCTCSLCATMWHVVRVKCVLCGSTARVSFRQIDGQPDTVKAESCEECRGYVKILYQVKDPALEALADDVASLGLDMLLAEEGWKRGGQNPFLIGY